MLFYCISLFVGCITGQNFGCLLPIHPFDVCLAKNSPLCCAWIWADEDAMSSDDELNWGERELQGAQMSLEDKSLKDMLLSRFGSHIGTLKLEFSKKKKKGKLPKEGRKVLHEWWNVHYKWPYPTVHFLFPPASECSDGNHLLMFLVHADMYLQLFWCVQFLQLLT